MKLKFKVEKRRMKEKSVRLVVFGIVLVLLASGIGTVSAFSNSGDGDWKYYKEITVKDNSGESLTGYQVLVELNPSNFPANANSDGSDLRFEDTNSKELNYWIEEWYYPNNAKIWVKVPSIPANGETKIKMYYGNEKANAVSDGDKVFEFFDDFDGNGLDKNKWESFNLGESGSVYVSGGYLVMEGGDHYNRGIKSKIIVPSNGKEIRGKYWIEMSKDYKYDDGDPTIGFFATDTSMEKGQPHSYHICDNDEYITDGVCIVVNDGSDVLGWEKGRISENYDARGKWSEEAISRIGNTFYGKIVGENDIVATKEWRYTGSYDFDNANIPVVFANNDHLDVKFDWVFIRKYTSPEPTTIKFSPEYPTTAPTPIIALSNAGGGDWEYYKEITIKENSGEYLWDYQVLVELNSANFDFSKAKSDGSDIRFSADGEVLNYWIEEWDASAKKAKIWVKVPSIPANGETKRMMYYGNPSASAVSDGDKVFDLFDDFEDGVYTDKWETLGDGYASESDGLLYFRGGYRSYDIDIQTIKNLSWENTLTEYKFKYTGSNIKTFYSYFNDKVHYPGYSNGFHNHYVDNSGYGSVHPSNGVWYTVTTIITPDKMEGTFMGETLIGTSGYSGLNGPFKGMDYDDYGPDGIYLDYIRIRKYTSPEPTLTLSAEHPTTKPTPAPPTPPSGKIKAVWLYNPDKYDTSTLMNDFKSPGINTIFLSTDVNNIWKYERFVKSSHENGIEVHAMILEDPRCALKENHASTIKAVETVLDYNDKSLAKFDGINIDTEPYVDLDLEQVWQDYITLLDAIHEKTAGKTILSADIPRWYDEGKIKDLAPNVDFFAIMAYDSGGAGWNTASEIEDAVASEMGAIRGEGSDAVIGIGVHEGFEDKEAVEECVDELYSYYSGDPAFLGVSIFKYESYSGLASAPEVTVPTGEEKGIRGFEAIFAVAGLLAVAYIFKRRK